MTAHWGRPVAVTVLALVLVSAAVAVVAAFDEEFVADGEGYAELACGLHLQQRPFDRATIKGDRGEREIAYAVAAAFLEAGNRERNTALQDLSAELNTALNDNDDNAFEQARAKADAQCGDHDELGWDPDELVEIACGITRNLEPGPGPEVTLVAHLTGAAGARAEKYESLAKAAAHLVIDPAAPLDSGHPSADEIDEFQAQCP